MLQAHLSPKHALNSTMSKKRRAEDELEDYSGTHVPPYEGQMMSEWRPDSCWSWLVCFASGISVAIVAGVTYSFGLLLPPLMENFEETRQAAGKRFRDAYKSKGRFTRYDFVACDNLTTGLRHELFRVNQTYNSLMTVVYVTKNIVRQS